MTASTGLRAGDPTGLHRVLDEGVVLPQAAQRLDTRAELWPDEVRVRVERLNLDAASFRQLERAHTKYGETDGHTEQVPCDGYAVLFGRSIAAVIPDDLDPALSLSVMDVCGAPALTARVVGEYVARDGQDGAGEPTVAVIGGAGKSGS